MVDAMIFPRDAEELLARAADIGQQSGGVVHFCISMPGDFLGHMQRGNEGVDDAQLIVRAWVQFRKSITGLPRGSRLQCPLCPRSLKPRSLAFGLAVPYGVEAPETGLMFGLCEACAPDRVTAEANAHRAMERVYPGMRALGVPALPGHA